MDQVTAQDGRAASAGEAGRRRLKQRFERGATTVEYALLIGVFVIGTLGALEFMTDRSSDELDERAGRAGSPDLDATGETTGTATTGTATTGTATTSGDSSVPAIEVEVEQPLQGSVSTGGNWTANVTVRVLDTNGDPVAQATVLGRWEFIQDGVPRVEEVSRASLADGTAPFSKTNMNTNGANKIDDVRFVLVDIVGTDPPIDFTLPEPPPSIVLTSGGTVIQP